jgi:hypothetical protein
LHVLDAFFLNARLRPAASRKPALESCQVAPGGALPVARQVRCDRQEPGTEGTLGTPSFEFGIIAGGRGNENGYNPWLPGDDDGIVSVESTRLAGAADFLLLPLNHAELRSDDKVLECTLRFLQHGYFVSPEKRQPIRETRNASSVR